MFKTLHLLMGPINMLKFIGICVIIWVLLRYIMSKVIRYLLFEPSYKVASYRDENHSDEYTQNGINLWIFERIKNLSLSRDKILLYCHGSGGNLSSRKNIITITNRLKLDLCLFDYRGYGRSKPTYYVTQQSIIDDTNTVFEYLLSKGYKKENIIICGTSMGSFTASSCAKDQRIVGNRLILIDTLSSLEDVAVSMLAWNRVMEFFIRCIIKLMRFNKIELLETKKVVLFLGCNVLMIHGAIDNLTPLKYAQEIHKIGPYTELVIIPKGDHYNILNFSDKICESIYNFIN